MRDHTFFADEHITKPQKFMEEMIRDQRVTELGSHYYNQIDYTKLPEQHLFRQFMDSVTDFGAIEHVSFLKQLKIYFDNQWKSN